MSKTFSLITQGEKCVKIEVLKQKSTKKQEWAHIGRKSWQYYYQKATQKGGLVRIKAEQMISQQAIHVGNAQGVMMKENKRARVLGEQNKAIPHKRLQRKQTGDFLKKQEKEKQTIIICYSF